MTSGGSGGSRAALDAELRGLRIIGAALTAAPAVFLCLVVFLHDPERPLAERPTEGMVSWAALFFATAVIVASLLIPRPVGADIGRVKGHLIVRLALVESGAMAGGVAYLLEGEQIGLASGAICIAVMALFHFPTRERVERLLWGVS